MSILKKIFGKSNKNDFEGVRIEKLKPFEEKREKRTDTVWFSPHNIEKCIIATKKLNLEYIFLQTKTIDFLNDKRLNHVKGICIQFKIEDLTPLYRHKQLTHLGIAEDNSKEFDFNHFKNLIYIGGIGPKKYINFDKLINLKYVYLRNYNKKDFSEFLEFKCLRTLEIYSLNCENFNGLAGLEKLKEIKLEMCPRITSLNGINETNKNLEIVHLISCKKLVDASILSSLPKLRDLYLYKVAELNSLEFLNSSDSIQELFIHPENVGVKKDDYYPLIKKLQHIGKIEQLKKWKKLDDYINNKVDLSKNQTESLSELQSILKFSPIKNWIEKYEDGLEQYTPENCNKGEEILSNLVQKLEQTKNLSNDDKVSFIKSSVLEFNQLNDSLDGCFIETGEREELCEVFDNIADSVGINIQKYEDGIASEWRDW